MPKKVSYAKFYLGRVNPMANHAPDSGGVGGASDRHNQSSLDISMMTESPMVSESKGLLRKSGNVQDDSVNVIPTTTAKNSKGFSTSLDEFTMMNFEQKFRRAAELQVDFDR